MREYIDLNGIYEQTQTFGDFLVYKVDYAQEASEIIRTFYNVHPSIRTNTILLSRVSDNKILMTNSEFEILTNKYFLDNATGDVLILGLGLGLVVLPLLNDPSITSITIIEKELDIINFIGNKILELDINKKVSILHGDAFFYHDVMTEERFDYIYVDFWADINENSLLEMDLLTNNYTSFLKNEYSKLTCWCQDIIDLLV